MRKYVAKAMTPACPETDFGDNGPIYRYFKEKDLNSALDFAFENRSTLFRKYKSNGLWETLFGNSGFEFVASLAVKPIGKSPWYVILDLEYNFPPSKKEHIRTKIESVKLRYGDKAFITYDKYLENLLLKF